MRIILSENDPQEGCTILLEDGRRAEVILNTCNGKKKYLVEIKNKKEIKYIYCNLPIKSIYCLSPTILENLSKYFNKGDIVVISLPTEANRFNILKILDYSEEDLFAENICKIRDNEYFRLTFNGEYIIKTQVDTNKIGSIRLARSEEIEKYRGVLDTKNY